MWAPTCQKSVFVTISFLSNVPNPAGPAALSPNTLTDGEREAAQLVINHAVLQKTIRAIAHGSNMKQRLEEHVDGPLALWMLSQPPQKGKTDWQISMWSQWSNVSKKTVKKTEMIKDYCYNHRYIITISNPDGHLLEITRAELNILTVDNVFKS